MTKPPGWDLPAILRIQSEHCARLGSPLYADLLERAALLSFVWPDQAKRLERLRAALAAAADFPVAVEQGAATEWTAERLAEPRPGTATVVFHSIVMQYLPEEERVEFEQRLSAVGEEADEDSPLFWLRMEPAGERAEVRLTKWPGGKERLLARAGYHGTPVQLLW